MRALSPQSRRPNNVSAPVLRGTNLNFFLARAEQARVEGDEATLLHVRERCRRSEAAWTELAEKAKRSERLRLAELDRKGQAPASMTNEEP